MATPPEPSPATSARRREALSQMSREHVATLYGRAVTCAESVLDPIATVTMPPGAWRALHEDVRDLCLALEELRSLAGSCVTKVAPDWSVIADLAKAGVYPDEIKEAYHVVTGLARRLDVETNAAVQLVAYALTIRRLGTPQP